MTNFDPTECLWDLTYTGDTLHCLQEYPALGCPCEGIGWLSNEWLYKQLAECTCHVRENDWDTYLHDPACDSVPCPFCPRETP